MTRSTLIHRFATKSRPILCTDLSAKAKIYSVISLAFRGKDIAFSPDIFQVDRLCGVRLDLAPEIVDMDLHRAHIPQAVLAPYLGIQLICGKKSVGMPDKQVELTDIPYLPDG